MDYFPASPWCQHPYPISEETFFYPCHLHAVGTGLLNVLYDTSSIPAPGNVITQFLDHSMCVPYPVQSHLNPSHPARANVAPVSSLCVLNLHSKDLIRLYLPYVQCRVGGIRSARLNFLEPGICRSNAEIRTVMLGHSVDVIVMERQSPDACPDSVLPSILDDMSFLWDALYSQYQRLRWLP